MAFVSGGELTQCPQPVRALTFPWVLIFYSQSKTTLFFIGSARPECVRLHESDFCALSHIFGELGLPSERLESLGSWEWATSCRVLREQAGDLEEAQLLPLYKKGGDACLPLCQYCWGNKGECVWLGFRNPEGSANVKWGFCGIGLLMVSVTSVS